MSEVCMFDILALPDDDLRKILPKASTRSLAKLVSAYPRAVSHTFFDVLGQCTSAITVEFLRDEISSMKLPSYPEIRQAEMELMKIMHEEHLDVVVSAAPPATPLPL
jgi:hypothetical protein